MAEVLGLAASIAGLISVAGSLTKLISALRDASRDGPTDLQSIDNEISNISVLAVEIQNCLSQHNLCEDLQLVVQTSNFEKTIKETMDCFKDIENNLVAAGLRRAQTSGKQLGYRVKMLKAAKHLKKYSQVLQRQKLVLLLALSTFSLHAQLQTNQSSRATAAILQSRDSSFVELQYSIAKTHAVVIQILEKQCGHTQTMTPVQSAVLQQIGLQLERCPATRVQARNGESCPQTSRRLDTYLMENSLGTWELAYGSLSLFRYSRFRTPEGGALRASYVFPSWLARMMISNSFMINMFSRPGIGINICYVAEVPWESEIFTFAQNGNSEAMARLFIDGKAAPTDRDVRGVTALHLAAYRQDIPMCKLLLSEGADPSAIMTYTSLEGLHITPLRYLALSSRFRSLPTCKQQEMLFLLGTHSFPKIRMRQKSVVQLFLAPNDIECVEGELSEHDISSLNIRKKDNCNVTFLMVASEFGAIHAIRVLIKHGIDIDAVDLWGNSALHYAADSGHADCIEELLVAGTTWQGVKNKDGVTADAMAIASGHGRIWDRAMRRAVLRRVEIVRSKRREKRIAQETTQISDFAWLFMDQQQDLETAVHVDEAAVPKPQPNIIHFSDPHIGNFELWLSFICLMVLLFATIYQFQSGTTAYSYTVP